MELKNFMEEHVVHKLDEIIAKYPNCCSCEACKRDIAILALNNLPPKYVSTAKGEIFARVDSMGSQYEVEVLRELTAAIEKVQAHPRHAPKK